MTRELRDASHRRRMRMAGLRIAQTRIQAGVTQAELADACGYQAAWIGRIERGENSIDAHDLYEVAKFLNRPIEFFLDPNPGGQPVSRRPRTMRQWEALDPEAREWARRHFELDQIYSPPQQSTDDITGRPWSPYYVEDGAVTAMSGMGG